MSPAFLMTSLRTINMSLLPSLSFLSPRVCRRDLVGVPSYRDRSTDWIKWDRRDVTKSSYKTVIERGLIDTETTKTFFNEKWIQENELKVEKTNSKKLKLENGSTKTLEHTIQEKLQITSKKIKETYWITKLNWNVILRVDRMNRTK